LKFRKLLRRQTTRRKETRKGGKASELGSTLVPLLPLGQSANPFEVQLVVKLSGSKLKWRTGQVEGVVR
jgi:hypothetical protein